MNQPSQQDQLCITTLRTLSIDAVQKANSGHPGTPMGTAPAMYALWQNHLRYDPQQPHWPDRDRFVLSAGHACALLYSMLHLTGVAAKEHSYPPDATMAVSLDDLKSFRQLGSRCTGHPERGWTSGIETTTGPLGQGAATSVGMALAQRWHAATYNRPGFELFSHRVYAQLGDGDMMEGLCSEAASLAAHWKLSNLCWLYDANHISIEGGTGLAFTEDVAARFEAYGWHVLHVDDGNDLGQLDAAYSAFLDVADRPTLIVMHSHIGYGAPHKQDTREAHGEPLGEDEVRAAKLFYGADPEKQFDIPAGVVEHFRAKLGARGADAFAQWTSLFTAYRVQFPELAQQLDQQFAGELPNGWDAALPTFAADAKGVATRESSGKVLNAIAAHLPWMVGGAADLAPSTKTDLTFDGAGEFEAASYGGRNLHFGVREHAMCAIGSGMALSGLRSYVSSFLIFTDYCRASLRLASMMDLPLISIWTHDSISLGEDGPTHQPIEQLASLRAMPGMIVLRPADANEVVAAWRTIMTLKDKPVCLVLTRQALPTLDRSVYASANGVAQGGYVLIDAADGQPDVVLVATGSEVNLCVQAQSQLTAAGVKARVVSMPSWELFDAQPQAYRDSVLPPAVRARVAVEEASVFGWERYVGSDGAIIGMRTFGASAPRKVVETHFGFDVDHIVAAANEQIGRHTKEQA